MVILFIRFKRQRLLVYVVDDSRGEERCNSRTARGELIENTNRSLRYTWYMKFALHECILGVLPHTHLQDWSILYSEILSAWSDEGQTDYWIYLYDNIYYM